MAPSRYSLHELYAMLIAQGTIATLAVALRFYARKMKRTKIWWDDWLAILAVLTFWGFNSMGLHAAHKELHGDRDQLKLEDMKLLVRLMVAAMVLTIPTITIARMSVILLYYRLFSISTRMRYGLWTVAVLSIAWFIEAILTTLFACRPIQTLYDPTMSGKYIALVCMPIPLLKRLKLPLQERIAVGGMFLLGGFVAITSIICVSETYDPNSWRYDAMNSQLWLSLQLSSAIVCACLPTYRPYLLILPQFISSHFPQKQWYNSVSHSMHKTHNGSEEAVKPRGVELGVLPEPDEIDTFIWNSSRSSREQVLSTQNLYTARIFTGSPDEDHTGDMFNSIHVRNDVSVV